MTAKTDSALLTQAATDIADNTNGDVSPADVRGLAVDIIDSKQNIALAENQFWLGNGSGVAVATDINAQTQDLTPIDTTSFMLVQRSDDTYRRIQLSDLPTDHTAANYAAANDLIETHLAGIDTAIGLRATTATVSEINQNADDLITLSGVAENATNLGTFTGALFTDSLTVKAVLQEAETAIEARATSSTVSEIDQNVNDLITLSGVAENASDLGTFTGSTIADNDDIKGALQALETAHEAAIAEFDRVVTATGGTTTLAEATHRNALIVLASGTNTVAAPSSDTGTWVVSVLNDTAADQTVAGQTVSAGALTSIIVQGTTATPFSTSQTKKVPVFIQTGADAVLFNGEIFDGPFTVLTARHVCASGSITIEIALESGDNTGSFTAVTSLSALSVTTTRATGTASGANTSSTGAARVRITGSSNSSATGIELSLRVRT